MTRRKGETTSHGPSLRSWLHVFKESLEDI